MSSFRQKFNRAVLIGLVGIAGLTGITANAQAQDRGFPQPVTVTQTQTQDDYKPWANDPNYIRQIQTMEEQSQLRISSQHARFDAQRANLNAQQANNINRQIQNVQRQQENNKRHHQGWSFGQILATGSNAGAASQNIESRLEIVNNNERSFILNEHNRLITAENNLDNQYARRFLNAEQQAARNAAQAQKANATAQANAGGGTLTPDQMHDQLVGAYQKAVLANAKAGKPLPDPVKFGLDKNDPAIQIGGPGGGQR